MIKANSLDYIEGLIHSLNKCNANYRIIEPQCEEIENIIDWLEEKFPVNSWGRIDWARVIHHHCKVINSDSRYIDVLDFYYKEYQLSGDVIVTWTNALKPALSMRIEDVIIHSVAILEEDWDTWIISKTGNWCIEIYHEGEVCIGFINNG